MSLIEQLSAYLTRVSGGRATVVRISRISGGASRETYRFDAEIDGVEKGYILRRDPPGSLIETDRRLEFLAIRSFTDKVREQAIFALTQSKEPEAMPAVIRAAHEDKSPKVRGQALFWMAQKAGPRAAEGVCQRGLAVPGV